MNLDCLFARTLLASTLATAMLVGAQQAAAETSATISASNMYLYRGVNLSNPNPQIAGSLDYAHNSGLYAGIWGSSEGLAGSSEYDLYAGYSVEMGALSFDANLTDYNYPSATGEEDLGDYTEVILGATFTQDKMSVEAKLADSIQGANSSPYAGGYYYTSLTGAYDKISVKWGAVSYSDTVELAEYQHIDLGFAFNDEVSFTLSKVVDTDQGKIADNDALFAVTWTKTFEM